MLRESGVPDIAMPECTFIYGPGIGFLAWTADVDSLTRLGCEHVSRFRRACHITFSVASSSIHVCLHELLISESLYTIPTFRRLPTEDYPGFLISFFSGHLSFLF